MKIEILFINNNDLNIDIIISDLLSDFSGEERECQVNKREGVEFEVQSE